MQGAKQLPAVLTEDGHDEAEEDADIRGPPVDAGRLGLPHNEVDERGLHAIAKPRLQHPTPYRRAGCWTHVWACTSAAGAHCRAGA